MADDSQPSEVESIARELCAGEGWDPDERVECAPDEVPLATLSANGSWTCLRWQAYAPAAERLARARADAWTSF
jgi:hypothetical protein